jgi:hypothetical protein
VDGDPEGWGAAPALRAAPRVLHRVSEVFVYAALVAVSENP